MTNAKAVSPVIPRPQWRAENRNKPNTHKPAPSRAKGGTVRGCKDHPAGLCRGCFNVLGKSNMLG